MAILILCAAHFCLGVGVGKFVAQVGISKGWSESRTIWTGMGVVVVLSQVANYIVWTP